MNAAWVVWTIICSRDIQTLLAGKYIKLSALSAGGDAKNFLYPSTSASAPYEPPGETFTF